MSVWVLVCVRVCVGVCVNTERDDFGGSECCSPTWCSAGVVATSTVCVLALHVLFSVGRGRSLMSGVTAWFCSVLAGDGAMVGVVGSVTSNAFLSLYLMLSAMSQTPLKLGCNPSLARCPGGSW